MSMWSALGGVIFDCDGVLIASNRIKADAFRSILSDEPAAAVTAFFDYFHSHPGLSRGLLFEHFYRAISPRPDWQRRTGEASQVFSDLTLSALLSCPEVRGAEMAVRSAHGAGVPCAVVSAADVNDLVRILSHRGIGDLFDAVCGGDRPKQEHIRELLAEGRLQRPLLYFGDSRVDMDAAEAFGAHFVFVSGDSEWSGGAEIAHERGHTVVRDLSELPLH